MNRILLAVAALVLWAGASLLPSGIGPVPAGKAAAQESAEIDMSLVAEMALGHADAPLTVIEYASFTCSFCRAFHEETFADFKANYIDTGKVRFIYREVYFDRFGLWAGMVARCRPAGADPAAPVDGVASAADTRRYFAIADLIYAQQAEWTKGSGPADIAGKLVTIGKAAGLTEPALDACLQDGDMARAMVAVYQKNATEHDIRSTPSFLIGGELATGAMSYDAFAALLDAKLDG